MRTAVAIAVLCALAACGGAAPQPAWDAGHALDAGPSDAGVHDAGWSGWYYDAGPPLDAGPFTDAGPPFIPPDGPELLVNQGGPILNDVELVTLTWAGHPFQAELDAFADYIPNSGWLTQVGSEYGVHVVGHARFTIPGAAPASFSERDALDIVRAGWDAGLWPMEVGDAGATPLWLVIYPPGTQADVLYAGEHYFATWDGGALIAGFVNERDADAGADRYETILSHELIEAATDPFVDWQPAYAEPAWGPLSTGFIDASEVGDLCESFPPADEAGFAFTRSWSNAAAEAGHDPCVPAPDLPYATVFCPTDDVAASGDQDARVPLQGVEWNGSGPFSVWIVASGGDLDLQPSLDRSSLAPGDSAILTLRVPFQAPSQQTGWVQVATRAIDGGTPGSCRVQLYVR